MRRLLNLWACSLCVCVAACATVPDQAPEEFTNAQEAAYQECLEANMAAAVAWEVIERSCRNQALGVDNPSPEFRLK